MDDSRPAVSNDVVAATYDRIAPLYDVVVAPFAGGTRRRALDLLAVGDGDRVLEVGCGPGHALVPLARSLDASGRVVGLDAAPGMVARASDRADRSGVGDRIDTVLGDARALPVAEDAVDAVFVEDTLELFSPAEADGVLRECARVLDPDGRLVVATMERADAEDDPFVRAYEWVYEHVPGYDRVGCRPIYARRALEVAGFAVEHRERHLRAHVWPVELLLARPHE